MYKIPIKIANFKHKKTVSSCETASFFIYTAGFDSVKMVFILFTIAINVVAIL